MLRPGGRLRMNYEALGVYRGGREHEAWLMAVGDEAARLLVCHRQVDAEQAVYCGLALAAPAAAVARALAPGGGPLAHADLTPERLAAIRGWVTDAAVK